MPTEKKQVQSDDSAREAPEEVQAADITEQGQALKEDIDKLLDEIDELLEEDSEEFVENYIQRGGQ
jgi:ubiquitin-like protein Pup